MRISPARQFAFRALLRVERDAAYVSELLERAKLEPGDRALAQQLTLGVLRWRGALDSALASHLKRPLSRLDLEVATALRLGAFQLLVLDKIPAHAAVSESVELVKSARKASAAGMVNAVLRKIPATGLPANAPTVAHPAWLVERWRQQWDDPTLSALLAANTHPPRTYIRLNVSHPRSQTLEKLAIQDLRVQETSISWCYEVTEGKPAATQAFAQGLIRLQDISSQAVATLVDALPDETFLDLCAAPGGKTMSVVERRGSAPGAVACDLHPARLRTLDRLATMTVPRVALDAAASLPFGRQFDWILLDAPCTGTGTLARHPEIKWRLQPADIARMAALQANILRNALKALAPGGRLVYSTCSLESEENRDVVTAVLATETTFAAETYLERVPGRDAGDGFFACRIVRV